MENVSSVEVEMAPVIGLGCENEVVGQFGEEAQLVELPEAQ